MKIYLVTGGAGFIGSNFIHYMFEKYNSEHKIINLDLLTYAGNLNNVSEFQNNNQYVFVKGDICDNKLVNKLFDEYPIDYVVNFAAESHVDRSIDDPGVFIKTNIEGTQSLMESAMKHWYHKGTEQFLPGKKFLQVSTDEVYGSLGDEGYFTETSSINPHSPYSASKASADLIAMAYHDTYGFPLNITRCSNNYGPYQFPEKLIPLIINNVLMGKPLPIYGDGLNVRDWLFVKDHCKAIDLVINIGKSGEVYNVGGHNEKKNIEIVNLIIEQTLTLLDEGDPRKSHISKDLITYIKDRKGHDRRYAIDANKIDKELGWHPEVMFNVGIVNTIRWYLEHQEWLDNLTCGEYLKYYEKIYPSRL